MLRVLIVDDSPIIRSSLAKFVERYDPSVVVGGEAGNGAEALAWLEEHYADLCLTDVRMPVMDGLELISALAVRCPWMVSVVVSSYDEFDYARQSIELDAVDYILKPIDPAKLNRALGRSIEKLKQARASQAGNLFIKRLPYHRELLERWLEQIRMLRMETLPLLIVDTLELLERWADGQYLLLNELAMCWLRSVAGELHDDKLSIELQEGIDAGIGEAALKQADVRFYYRLCAVRRLEEGAYLLAQSMLEARDGQASRMIEATKAYMEAHCAEKLSIQELAERACISRTHMANLFKQETGYTVNQYLVEARMRKARDLLLQTALKSYEIAAQVGYEDVIYFAQLFKKHYGVAPMEYKKRMES